VYTIINRIYIMNIIWDETSADTTTLHELLYASSQTYNTNLGSFFDVYIGGAVFFYSTDSGSF
jgi:hypothetical protein